MVKQSPHTRWKGCPICKPHKLKGTGTADRTPWRDLRKLGVKRRLRKGDLGD